MQRTARLRLQQREKVEVWREQRRQAAAAVAQPSTPRRAGRPIISARLLRVRGGEQVAAFKERRRAAVASASRLAGAPFSASARAADLGSWRG